jgi:hypothetical protein
MSLYGILPDMQISSAVARALSFRSALAADPSDPPRDPRGRPAPPLASLSAKDVFEAASSKDFNRLKRSVTVSLGHTSPALGGSTAENRRHTVTSPVPSGGHHASYHSGQRDQFVSAKMTTAQEGFLSSDRFSTQLRMADRTLDFLYPDLLIDLRDPNGTSCPRGTCQKALTIIEIIKAFPTDSNCYTVRCPYCQREYVPRFTVSSSLESWEGSEGKGTPLWCELLSPWVLQKEVLNVIMSTGIETIVSPSFRDSHLKPQYAVLFWNLMVYFRLYGLPYAFLITEKMSLAFLIPLDD